MFVFKAAVVGAGTMGGEIAQAIAAADIQVVLKDVDQKFVDVGLEKAREVTAGPGRPAGQEGARSPRSRPTRRSRSSSAASPARRPTRASATSTSSSRPSPSGWSSSRRVFAELDDVTPGHAILASNTSSLSITEIGDATLAPREGRRLPLLLPGVGHAAARDRRWATTPTPETVTAAVNFAQTIRKQPITCAEVPGLRRQPHPQLVDLGGLARAGGAAGSRSRRSTRPSRRRERRADGAVLPRRPARPRHRPARRRAPRGVLRRPLLRPPGHAAPRRPRASSARRPAATASTRTASRRSRATASPPARSCADLLRRSRRSSRRAWCSRRASRRRAPSTSA